MSLCIVVADSENRKGEGLDLLHVSESIIPNHANKQFFIYFDLLISNGRGRPIKLFLLHPGNIKLSKATSSIALEFNQSSTQITSIGTWCINKLLKKLYEDQFEFDSKRKLFFHPRKNCFNVKKQKIPVQFYDNTCQLTTAMSLALKKAYSPYTAIVIEGIRPGTNWIRVAFSFFGETYEHFIRHDRSFWVYGPSWVLEEIAKKEIPYYKNIDPEFESFFEDNNIFHNHILPRTYDVVLARPGCEGADSDTDFHVITGDTYNIPIADKKAKNMAHFFTTDSPDFWIDFNFVNSTKFMEKLACK